MVGFCDALVSRGNTGRWLRYGRLHSTDPHRHDDDSANRNQRYLRCRGRNRNSADRANCLNRFGLILKQILDP